MPGTALTSAVTALRQWSQVMPSTRKVSVPTNVGVVLVVMRFSWVRVVRAVVCNERAGDGRVLAPAESPGCWCAWRYDGGGLFGAGRAQGRWDRCPGAVCGRRWLDSGF